MKKWTRWQDYVALAAGVLMVLTPLWSSPGGGGTTAMLVLGVVLGLTALWSLYDPGAIASEYSHAALGVLMVLTPWVFAFTGTTVAAVTCWILGVVAVAVGLLAVPESAKAHQQLAH
jgi:hypothetical protein